MRYTYYTHNRIHEGSYEDNVEWLNSQYEKYGNRIISSNFAEDNTSVTAYATILSEPQAPTSEKTPVILK